jgi:hypothetical protein
MMYYACPIWTSAARTHIRKLQLLQSKCLHIATSAPWYIGTSKFTKTWELRSGPTISEPGGWRSPRESALCDVWRVEAETGNQSLFTSTAVRMRCRECSSGYVLRTYKLLFPVRPLYHGVSGLSGHPDHLQPPPTVRMTKKLLYTQAHTTEQQCYQPDVPSSGLGASVRCTLNTYCLPEAGILVLCTCVKTWGYCFNKNNNNSTNYYYYYNT